MKREFDVYRKRIVLYWKGDSIPVTFSEQCQIPFDIIVHSIDERKPLYKKGNICRDTCISYLFIHFSLSYFIKLFKLVRNAITSLHAFFS